MKISKKQQVINLIKNGEAKKALSLMKGFNREFSKSEQRHIQIANECWTDNSKRKFYSQIGVDFNQSIEISKSLMASYGG